MPIGSAGDFNGNFIGDLYNNSKTARFTIQDDLNTVLYCEKQNDKGSALWSRTTGNSGRCNS
jgi:hypothetical protein